MKKTAFSLVELLVVISISGILLLSATNAYTRFLHQHYATLTLQQLQYAFHYARSEALLNHHTVTICPSFNRISCGGNWREGILVVTPNGEIRFFNTFRGHYADLRLQQSGFSNSSVQIQSNGMTYSNGHFTYKSLKTKYLPHFNLYFNKTGRLYVEVF